MSKSFILNPFNVLGLYSDCSQNEMRKRVGLIEKMLAIDEDVTRYTGVLLEPSVLTMDMIKSSESRLNNPQDRIADVFFWFADNPKAVAAAEKQDGDFFRELSAQQESAQKRDFLEEKNAAIGLSVIFECSQEITDFEDALAEWTSFIHSDAFWDYWIKYYKSIDCLDTSDRLLQEFKENIDSIIVDKFFEVSQLDDLIDAQIVGKYFKVSSEAAEKAAEQQLIRIKELRMEADRLRSSDTLLNNSHVLSSHSKKQITDLLDKSISLHKELIENGQQDAPAIERELNSLWSDVLTITIAAHNASAQFDAVDLKDLKFQKKIIEQLLCESTDSLLGDRLKENLELVNQEVSELEEQEKIEPYFGQLAKLMDELANAHSPSKSFVEEKLNEFMQIYLKIKNSDKLKYETLANMVTMAVGIFNMLATTFGNAAQERVNKAIEIGRSGYAMPIERVVDEAYADVVFSQKVLNRLKAVEVDPSLRSTIDQNYRAAVSVQSSLERARKQIKTGSSGGGGCYIATAVYGSYDCPQVWTLRRFRDNKLAKSLPGRAFIHTYYAISPTLVRLFGEAAWFKTLCKRPLDGLVNKCISRGYSDQPYEDQPWT